MLLKMTYILKAFSKFRRTLRLYFQFNIMFHCRISRWRSQFLQKIGRNTSSLLATRSCQVINIILFPLICRQNFSKIYFPQILRDNWRWIYIKSFFFHYFKIHLQSSFSCQGQKAFFLPRSHIQTSKLCMMIYLCM